ncbi:MAG: hypothetical protein Q8M34_07400 [Thermodesulfovibrionales bacterium]|jgi:hypothetical protein|nr:hypothetical protein [Thermodesulfovibrionales bacterium]
MAVPMEKHKVLDETMELFSLYSGHALNIFVYYRFMLAVIIIGGIWLKG